MSKERLILVTNDDGIKAKGLRSLVEAMKPYGKVVVVAPEAGQSGMSQAITVKHPLRIHQVKEFGDIPAYTVNGTPVDCVKLAINQLVDRRPDLLVSGINHGSNSSTSVLYSGTMGAALEGSINQIPSIGFSLISFDHDADFKASIEYSRKIAGKVLENGLPKNICLNVNIPYLPVHEIKGVKVCRQTRGHWKEEFDKRQDPAGRTYYWLTGSYHNHEPEAEDTDEWALKNNYISLVPTQTDLTCYNTIKTIDKWNL